MKSLLFVDDEPRVLQGLERQLRGLRDEWDMKFVGDGAEALAFLESTPVDVIVTDLLMPGMDGAQLLTEVRSRHPKTVRLVLSGHSSRESELWLVGPAHQCLSKPCDPEELRAALVRAIALRDLLSSDQLRQLASRVRSLPTLPDLYTRLAEELQKDEPSIGTVAAIISKDVGMTAKILQLVNSAFFGLAQPAATLSEAVNYLGLSTIRSLVLSLKLFSQFDEWAVRSFSIKSLEEHSWLVGVLAQRIAQMEHSERKISDDCFLAGMLHDVGHLILAAGLPGPYHHVLHNAETSGQPISERERAEFGATHAELGAYLLGLWGLPEAVVEAVAMHHCPSAGGSRGFSPLTAVHVADCMTPCLGFKPEAHSPQRIDRAFLTEVGLEGRLEEWKSLCVGALEQSSEI
jgi:HD-like signal output (HDOD) protein